MDEGTERGLKRWEVSLIRGMLVRNFAKQDILAYFSTPERSVNQARISEIENGTHDHSHTRIASPDDVRKFMAGYPSVRDYMSEWEQKLG